MPSSTPQLSRFLEAFANGEISSFSLAYTTTSGKVQALIKLTPQDTLLLLGIHSLLSADLIQAAKSMSALTTHQSSHPTN